MCSIWFTSCGSHQSSIKRETTIEFGSNRQRKDTTSASMQVKKNEDENVAEETEEVTTVYDTSRPNDPITGKPPVFSETKKTTKKETNNKKNESLNTTLNQSIILLTNDSTKVGDKNEKVNQKIETAVPRQIGWIVWGLVSLVGLIIVGWLVYRIRRK